MELMKAKDYPVCITLLAILASSKIFEPLQEHTVPAYGVEDVLAIIAILFMVVAAVISMVFRPKPTPPIAAGLSDFQAPTAGEGRAIPEVIGTVRVKGPNVVWYGNPYTDPIPAPSGGSSGGS